MSVAIHWSKISLQGTVTALKILTHPQQVSATLAEDEPLESSPLRAGAVACLIWF